MQSSAGAPVADQQQWMTMMHQDQQLQQSMHHIPQTYEEIRTLWVGDLQYWMDENYLRGCFFHTGEQVSSVKIIRNKQTSMSEGYGFVDFISHGAAERVLQTYNGTAMPQTEQAFRLNWAFFGAGERRFDGGSDHSIFVGDLPPDVTDYMLLDTFRSRYLSIKGARVVVDPATGRSKGYGFVRFGDEYEKQRALTEMNGAFCSTRPMRISEATPKKSLGVGQQYNQKVSTASAIQSSAYSTVPAQGYSADNDPNNSTIFVGGLDPNVTEDDLRQIFGQFGEVVYVKIPAGKGCGFVQYMHRSCAEEALQKLHGYFIGQQAIRLSWGRSPANKQQEVAGNWSQDPNTWAGGYYGYSQGYDGYGYMQGTLDPGAYYGYGYGYGTYPPQETEPQAGVVAIQEYREEIFDPFAPVDINKMNVAYISIHEPSLLARPFWMTTNEDLL